MSDQKESSSNDIVVILMAAFGALALIYFIWGHAIIKAYLTFKLWELELIKLAYPSDMILKLISVIETKPIGSWTIKEVAEVGGYVSRFIDAPILLIIGFLTYKVWKLNPTKKFTRVFNMQTLKESEAKLWPYITPVLDIDFMAEPFDKGPYAMAMNPYDYAVKYKLLQDERNVSSLDKVKAEKIFVSQLGRLWDGFDKLKKHEKALFLTMAAHGCGDKNGAMKAVAIMAETSTKDHRKMPKFDFIDELVKYAENPKVKEICQKHSYVYTVMAQMMEFSRTTGVFPPSYLIWLKPRDRTLWYVLNCVGRQVSFVETAGIFGHWKAEQMAEHKLDAPFVSKAVDGLERALSEVKIAK